MNDRLAEPDVAARSALARRVWLRGAAASGLAMTGVLLVGCAQNAPRSSGAQTELRAYLGDPTAANGVCEATYDAATNVLDWQVKWSRMKGRFIRLDFIKPIAAAQTDRGLAGNLSLTRVAAEDLVAGRVHISVMTSEFPGGEVRGRIHRDDSQPTPDRLAMTAILTGGKLPTPNDSGSRGRLIGTLDPATRQFDWQLRQTALDGMATGVMLESELPHSSLIGSNGIKGKMTLMTEDQVADLLGGRWMVSVATTVDPLGEIRGQLVPQK